MGRALLPAYHEVAEGVRAAAVKNVEETGWKQAGKRRWLWAAVTATAALFVVHRRRGAVGLRALLGEAVPGLIVSDRWSAYQAVPLCRRQVCWAHLRRDFQGMVDRGGEAAEVGQGLLEQAKGVFGLWYKVRDGTRGRAGVCRQLGERGRPGGRSPLRGGGG